jgi:hypothetical protein
VKKPGPLLAGDRSSRAVRRPRGAQGTQAERGRGDTRLGSARAWPSRTPPGVGISSLRLRRAPRGRPSRPRAIRRSAGPPAAGGCCRSPRGSPGGERVVEAPRPAPVVGTVALVPGPLQADSALGGLGANQVGVVRLPIPCYITVRRVSDDSCGSHSLYCRCVACAPR